MGKLGVRCRECKLPVELVRLSCGTKLGLSRGSEESGGAMLKKALSAHAPVTHTEREKERERKREREREQERKRERERESKREREQERERAREREQERESRRKRE